MAIVTFGRFDKREQSELSVFDIVLTTIADARSCEGTFIKLKDNYCGIVFRRRVLSIYDSVVVRLKNDEFTV